MFGSRPWEEDIPTAGRKSHAAVLTGKRLSDWKIGLGPRVATAAETPARWEAIWGPRAAFVWLPSAGLLLLAVGLVFGQTAGFGFVNYDDGEGVYENRLVTGDLTLRGRPGGVSPSATWKAGPR